LTERPYSIFQGLR